MGIKITPRTDSGDDQTAVAKRATGTEGVTIEFKKRPTGTETVTKEFGRPKRTQRDRRSACAEARQSVNHDDGSTRGSYGSQPSVVPTGDHVQCSAGNTLPVEGHVQRSTEPAL